jgi:catechol 2,3-dioxygenase-like lactoylglutathione lyase family enzyme
MTIARSVNHISFPVRDLASALGFYRDLLGLEVVARPDFGVDGAWLSAGNAQIHLIVTPAGMTVDQPPPSLNPAASHLAFAVDDYGATLERVQDAGLEVLTPGAELGQMWVRDPDGHVIELIDASVRR